MDILVFFFYDSSDLTFIRMGSTDQTALKNYLPMQLKKKSNAIISMASEKVTLSVECYQTDIILHNNGIFCAKKKTKRLHWKTCYGTEFQSYSCFRSLYLFIYFSLLSLGSVSALNQDLSAIAAYTHSMAMGICNMYVCQCIQGNRLLPVFMFKKINKLVSYFGFN